MSHRFARPIVVPRTHGLREPSWFGLNGRNPLLAGLALWLWLMPVHAAQANAVHEALKNNQFERAAELIRGGADVNARGPKGDTALHWVAFHGKASLAHLLIERGADVGARVRNGNTPLHLAAYAGETGTTTVLLGGGANVNSRNFEDLSPLHWAARNGHVEVIELLLARGANPAARDLQDRTPLDLAGLEQRDAAYELLRRHMQHSGAIPADTSTQRSPVLTGTTTRERQAVTASGSLSRTDDATPASATTAWATSVARRRPTADRRQATASRGAASVSSPAPMVETRATPGTDDRSAAASAAEQSMAWVQMGAVGTQESASKLAQRLKHKHAEVLESVPVAVQRGEAANGSTVFRVRAGPLAHSDARALCGQLKSRKQDCYVARIEK